MRDGFISVAAGTPKIRVADCRYNAEQIFTLMREADKQGVKVLALPACGFRESHRVPNFFLQFYDHPIYEGGRLLSDMVYLSMEL